MISFYLNICGSSGVIHKKHNLLNRGLLDFLHLVEILLQKPLALNPF